MRGKFTRAGSPRLAGRFMAPFRTKNAGYISSGSRTRSTTVARNSPPVLPSARSAEPAPATPVPVVVISVLLSRLTTAPSACEKRTDHDTV